MGKIDPVINVDDIVDDIHPTNTSFHQKRRPGPKNKENKKKKQTTLL